MILFSLSVCVIRKIISFATRKQQKESAERNKKVAELQKESDNNEELTDKIYEYYKQTGYNPILNILLKSFVIILDLTILMSAFATFKPITNFHIISKESAASVVSIYQDNEGPGANRYTEIRLLEDLDKYTEQYKAAGVTDEEIHTLEQLKDTFSFMGMETYIVPSIGDMTVQVLPCLFAFLLFAINSVWNLVVQLKQAKGVKISDPDVSLSTKISVLVAPITNIICSILVCTFIFQVPIVLSFYLIVNYGWSLGEKIVNKIKQRKEEWKIETKNCIA